MTTILVTLDGSTTSEAVLPVVRKLAADLPAEVRLFAVVAPGRGIGSQGFQPANFVTDRGGSVGPSFVNPRAFLVDPEPEWVESGEQATRRMVEEAEDRLESLASSFAQQGIPVTTSVAVSESPAGAIIAQARDADIDIIAMATHGRGGLTKLAHGSVAQEVLLSGVKPVLLLRPHLGNQ